ncbi:MAG: histidine phosphatase family protein [Actinomycetota bacterium]|nr:histidine phosphatase family protein [Actinomycetota bacterium]
MPVTVHLVRHGEVENPKGVIYGRLPGYHLSERGKGQARAAARRLADADLAAVWASPLERAQETAAEIAEPHGLEVVTDERLIESGNTFEGVGRTVWHLISNPAHWWRFRNPLRPSWGESFGEIRERMTAAIAEAAAGAETREVAIVSHQTPVLVARLALARRRVPPWLAGTPCETGSVTTMTLENGAVLSASYFSAEATDS